MLVGLYFHAEQTSRAAAFITDCMSSWFPGRPVSLALPCHSPDVTAPARRPATVVLLGAGYTDRCCAAGVAQRSSYISTQTWRYGSASTRRNQRKFLGREPIIGVTWSVPTLRSACCS